MCGAGTTHNITVTTTQRTSRSWKPGEGPSELDINCYNPKYEEAGRRTQNLETVEVNVVAIKSILCDPEPWYVDQGMISEV